jgi:hypothetical protein
MTSYPDGKWLPVANVAVDPGSSDYKSKYNLDGANPNGSVNVMTQISLCFESTGASNHCPGANTLSGVTNSGKCAPDTKNNGTWYAEFRSPVTQTAKVFCVMYRPTPDNSQPPGVVSWRWTLKDETVWISCPLGCCEGNSIGT